jgi:hypothetical protein
MRKTFLSMGEPCPWFTARSTLNVTVLGKIRTSEAIPSDLLTNHPVLTAVAGSTYLLAENPKKPSQKSLVRRVCEQGFSSGAEGS